MERKSLQIDNLQVFYSTYGEAQSKKLLFLHGGGGFASTYNALLENLAKDFHVIAIDLPGCGISDIPNKQWELYDYAEFINKFIQENVFDIEYIVGHSLGGAIVAKYLELFKTQTNAILIDPVPSGYNFRFLVVLYNLIKKSILNLFISDSAIRISLLIASGARRFIFKPKHLQNMLYLLKNTSYSISDSISKVYILWGNRDTLFSKSNTKKLAESSTSEFIEVEGGHDWCAVSPHKLPQIIQMIEKDSTK